MSENQDLAPGALHARIEAGAPPLVLDVRSRHEFAQGHVPGAVNIPFWTLPWRARRIARAAGEPIVVYCGHGPRAAVARRVLEWHGFTRVVCLAGHMAGWRRGRYPESKPS